MHTELEDELDRLKHDNTLLIVEGIKDERALRRVGLTNILALNKRPLYKIIDECYQEHPCGKIAILTDLDSEGKKLYSKLHHQLNQLGLKVDNRFRHFLYRKTKLRQIEGLTHYLERR